LQIIYPKHPNPLHRSYYIEL